MLNIMRRAASTIVMKFLMGILVVSFAAWGVSYVFVGGGKRGVASVGGVLISEAAYAKEFQDELNNRNRDGKASLDARSAIALGIDKQVLQRMVYREMLLQAANKAGLRVDDAEVAKAIQALPVFQSDLGFDRLTFQNVLSQLNMTESQLTEVIRADTSRQAILNALIGPVSVPTVMVNLYYGFQTEERSVDFFQVESRKLEVAAPTDDDLQAYYKDHPNEFMAPEYRSFTSLAIRQADLEKTIEVSDEDLQKAYDASASEYMQPETRSISQLVVPTEEEADKLSQQIAGGASFADIAKAEGKSLDDTKLGDVTLEQMEAMNKDVAAAAFAPKEPTVTKPVKSPFGWHILDVTAINPSRAKPLDEVKDQVRSKLVEDKVVDEMYDLSNKAQDALSGGATVEDVAQEFNLRLKKTPLIDASGYGTDGVKPQDAPSQEVIDKAFETAQDAYPELQQMDDKDFLLVRVDEVVPAAVRPFDTVQDKVMEAVLADRRHEAAAKKAEALKAEAEKGDDLKALAEANGFVFRQAEDVSRTGKNAPAIFGTETAKAMFAAPKGGVFMAVGSDGMDYVIARVTDVKRGDPGSDLPGTTQLTEVLKQVLANNIMAEWEAALNAELDVKIYPQMAAQAIDPNAQP